MTSDKEGRPPGMWRLRSNTHSDEGQSAPLEGLLTRADLWLMMAGAALVLLISYLLGRHRIFWEDEMLGWMLLTDPSWHHMLQAWNFGADGGGLTFYVTGRMWFFLFGASEISFRAYSATCFAAAFCVLWTALRRFYTTFVVAVAIFNVWFLSQTIVTHLAEGRFYGLLMLGTAWAVLLLVRADAVERPSARLYLLTFSAHALLVTSHLLGIVYSATLLLALTLLDQWKRRTRPLLWLTIIASWLLLIPERAAIVATAQVGRPHFWTTQPNLSRWIGAYSAYGGMIAAILVVLWIVALLRMSRAAERKATLQRAFRDRAVLYVVTGCLLLVPVELFLAGLVGPSLFINRYLMPVAIAQIILICEALTLANLRTIPYPWRTRSRIAAFAAFLLVLTIWDVRVFGRTVMPRPNYTDALTRALPRGLPVVCEDAWAFTELIGRQHAFGVRFVYLLDWPYSISDSAPRLEVTQYHLMENWKRAGYFAGSIEDWQSFLQRNPRFLIFHQPPGPGATGAPFIGNPWLQRLRQDPRYQVIPYVSPTGIHDERLWLACRNSCGSNASDEAQ